MKASLPPPDSLPAVSSVLIPSLSVYNPCFLFHFSPNLISFISLRSWDPFCFSCCCCVFFTDKFEGIGLKGWCAGGVSLCSDNLLCASKVGGDRICRQWSTMGNNHQWQRKDQYIFFLLGSKLVWNSENTTKRNVTQFSIFAINQRTIMKITVKDY